MGVEIIQIEIHKFQYLNVIIPLFFTPFHNEYWPSKHHTKSGGTLKVWK
jgi:hypothetical protein